MATDKNAVRHITWLPLAAVILLMVIILLWFFSNRQTEFRELCPVDGVLDITEEDLSEEVVNIVNDWAFYPNKLYSPQDFTSGAVEMDLDETGANCRYGTYRLVIQAQPRQYYAMTGYSVDYSTLVFVNGTEVYACGTVADNAAESVSQIVYMTIPMYSGETGEIELIFQYSYFVHNEGGFLQPLYLSTPKNIADYNAGLDLVSLTISGGMMLLFLYFLLCAAVQRRLDFLLLALVCLLMALRDQNFLTVHLLRQSVSWYATYRILIIVTALLPGSVLLLLHCMYREAAKRRVAIAFLVLLAVGLALILLLPTTKLVKVSTAMWLCAIPYLLYLIWCIVRHYFHKRVFKPVDALTVSGFLLLIFALVAEGFLVRVTPAITRYGIVPSAMLIFVLLIAIAISLQIQAKEALLAEIRSRSEILKRMNQMNIDFLHKIAHELKTPLTVISGYAQLTGLQFAAHSTTSETSVNLKTIQNEAKRLADMVTNLINYSYGKESESRFSTVEVGPLLESVQAICTPMCLKNSNQTVLEGKDCVPVYGNASMLLQIFINLVVNANRHTKNGVITLSASDKESREYVVFRVADTGTGISEDILSHIFEKGYSGDGGSGLGLAICLEAVEAHGGTLKVERTGPEGTVFSFTVLRKEIEP